MHNKNTKQYLLSKISLLCSFPAWSINKESLIWFGSVMMFPCGLKHIGMFSVKL
jgi:hypothetical protein